MKLPSFPGKAKWLIEHGGRDITDIRGDLKGEYVLMRDGRKKKCVRIYLPNFKKHG
jgi:hypothetical protein